MTWRCIWDIPGTPFPAHADYATEVDAHRHALRLSAEIGGEVAVVALGGDAECAPGATKRGLGAIEGASTVSVGGRGAGNERDDNGGNS